MKTMRRCFEVVAVTVMAALFATATGAQPPEPEFRRGRPREAAPEERGEPGGFQGDMGELRDLVRQLVRELPPGIRPEEFIEFARQHFSEAMEQARRLLSAQRVDAALGSLRRLIPEFVELRELRRRDPEQFKFNMEIRELERESLELARKCRETRDAGERAELEKKLEELLDKTFELKQSAREKEAVRLEKQLNELRESIAARKKNKAQIIKNRLEQLTGKREILEW